MAYIYLCEMLEERTINMSHEYIGKRRRAYFHSCYLVITNADADGHPNTMVIEPGDTNIAIRTMCRM